MHPHGPAGGPAARRALQLSRTGPWTVSPSAPLFPSTAQGGGLNWGLLPIGYNQLIFLEDVGGSRRVFRPKKDWKTVPGLGGGAWRTQPLPQPRP